MQGKADLHNEDKACEKCGRELFGRTDKRFCNDNCRNEFNRRKKQQELLQISETMPEILRIIRRNYEILRSYGEIEKDTEIFVKKEKIKKMGFNFKFFTSIDDTDEPYRYCFEKGFRVIGDYVYIKDDPRQAEIF